MPTVSQTRQLAVTGHLPARLEPGSPVSPGPAAQRKPTVNPPVRSRCASDKREACLGSRPAKGSIPPNRNAYRGDRHV